MNLKLKTTIVWFKRIAVSIIWSVIIMLLLWLIVWLFVSYPMIIGWTTLGLLIVFALVDSWLCIYHDLKEERK